MSVEDAKKTVDIGCTGIMVSNHGGKLVVEGSADQLVNAVEINWMILCRWNS